MRRFPPRKSEGAHKGPFHTTFSLHSILETAKRRRMAAYVAVPSLRCIGIGVRRVLTPWWQAGNSHRQAYQPLRGTRGVRPPTAWRCSASRLASRSSS